MNHLREDVTLEESDLLLSIRPPHDPLSRYLGNRDQHFLHNHPIRRDNPPQIDEEEIDRIP